MQTDLAKRDITIEGGLVKFSTVKDAYTFAEYVVKSGLAPSSFKTPEAVITAIQYGAEMGLKPMQSLQGLSVVNGRVACMDKSARAVVAASGKLEDIQDWIEGQGDAAIAFCKVKRKGITSPATASFSMVQAKAAGLLGKGPWAAYPRDMLAHKASARAHAALFSDILCGLPIHEDVQEVPPERKPDYAEVKVVDPLMESLPQTIDVEPLEPGSIEVDELGTTPVSIAEVQAALTAWMRSNKATKDQVVERFLKSYGLQSVSETSPDERIGIMAKIKTSV